MNRPSIWKIVGLAGIAGVAATGVAVARAERQRRALKPDEIRARLHERVASIEVGAAPPMAPNRRPSHLSAVMTRLRSGRDALLQRWHHDR